MPRTKSYQHTRDETSKTRSTAASTNNPPEREDTSLGALKLNTPTTGRHPGFIRFQRTKGGTIEAGKHHGSMASALSGEMVR
jgi:hypothetical protein